MMEPMIRDLTCHELCGGAMSDLRAILPCDARASSMGSSYLATVLRVAVRWPLVTIQVPLGG